MCSFSLLSMFSLDAFACLFVYNVYFFVYMFVCMSICLYVCMFISLFVCVFVYFFFYFSIFHFLLRYQRDGTIDAAMIASGGGNVDKFN